MARCGTVFVLTALLTAINLFILYQIGTLDTISSFNFDRYTPQTIPIGPQVTLFSSAVFTNRIVEPPFKHNYDDYEDAWVLNVSLSRNIIRVETVESKIVLEFQAPTAYSEYVYFEKLRKVPVSFDCYRNSSGKCDFIHSYLFVVSGNIVKIKKIKFLKSITDVWVGHGPGDKDPAYTNGLAIHAQNGKVHLFLELRQEGNSIKPLVRLKREDKVALSFVETQPYHVYVNGLKMRIVGIVALV